MARLVRVYVFDGPEEWIESTIKKSLPVGINDKILGDNEKKIFVIEPDEIKYLVDENMAVIKIKPELNLKGLIHDNKKNRNPSRPGQ